MRRDETRRRIKFHLLQHSTHAQHLVCNMQATHSQHLPNNKSRTTMDDAELQAIRAARLQEMQRNANGGENNGDKSNQSANGSSKGNGNGSATDMILTQILTHDAKERLNRVRMVKPERVAGVESYLIRLYQSGSMSHSREKIGESELVEMLERIGQQERAATATRIRFARRGEDPEPEEDITTKSALSDDDDDDFFDE